MLTPVDAPISTVEAKKVFREWMLKIGYLDKEEVGEHVQYFADEIRNQEEFLKSEVTAAKDDLALMTKDLKEDARALKKKLAAAKTEEQRASLQDDFASVEEELQSTTLLCQEGVDKAQQVLDSFKADKRAFLLQAVNQQTQAK